MDPPARRPEDAAAVQGPSPVASSSSTGVAQNTVVPVGVLVSLIEDMTNTWAYGTPRTHAGFLEIKRRWMEYFKENSIGEHERPLILARSHIAYWSVPDYELAISNLALTPSIGHYIDRQNLWLRTGTRIGFVPTLRAWLRERLGLALTSVDVVSS
nr:MAG: hypothetical protein [clictilig virus 3]